jgi:hypothetical protein
VLAVRCQPGGCSCACAALPCADTVLLLPCPCYCRYCQLVEELLTFWSLEDYEDSLEELEEALIVSSCSWMRRLVLVCVHVCRGACE